MDIAIIDTGISLKYFDNVISLKSNMNFSVVGKVCEDSIPNNTLTHGTICASIIKTYAPNASLHSLNVFINGVSKLESIIAAIRYCLEKNIKIINISFGVNYIENDSDLKKIINLATKKGIIIIASTSKNGITTYPACYDNVIGVGVNPQLILYKNKIKSNENPLSSINIFACGIQRLYKDMRLIHITSNEPSYATAVVTALVHNIYNTRKDITIQTIIDILSL